MVKVLKRDSELFKKIMEVQQFMDDKNISIVNYGGTGMVIYDHIDDQQFIITRGENSSPETSFPAFDETKFILME